MRRVLLAIACFLLFGMAAAESVVSSDLQQPSRLDDQPLFVREIFKSTAHFIRDLVSFDDEDRENLIDRENRDLAAQEAMALWAKRMTIATYVSVGVSAGGLILVVGTVLYARSSNIAARAQTRPYLLVDDIQVLELEAGSNIIRARTKLKNYGVSPASDVQVNVQVIYGQSPNQNLITLDTAGELLLPPPLPNPSTILVGPGSHINNIVECVFDTNANRDTARVNIMNGSGAIYVLGRVEYTDVFKDKHFTRFQYMSSKITIEANGSALIATTKGNYHG